MLNPVQSRLLGFSAIYRYTKFGMVSALGPVHLNVNTSSACVYRFGNWVIRCFVGNSPDDSRERYLAINDYIGRHRAQLFFLVPQEWVERGVQVNRVIWPCVKSPYVPHISLGRFLQEIVFSKHRDQTIITKIAQQWFDIIRTLESLHIAHGDLDLTNVLVCGTSPDITLKLVDFDNMYVPALAGRQPWEHGHEHFQPIHPELHRFDEEMDRFPALVIYLSLIALAEDPLLWERCQANEGSKLLLGSADFRDLKNSYAYHLLHKMQGNTKLQKCLSELASSIEEVRMPRPLSEVLRTPRLAFPSKFSELRGLPQII